MFKVVSLFVHNVFKSTSYLIGVVERHCRESLRCHLFHLNTSYLSLLFVLCRKGPHHKVGAFSAGMPRRAMRYGLRSANGILWAPRLVAMIRSAYGIRIVGVGVLDDPSGKFDLDGQIFPLPTHARRMEFVMNHESPVSLETGDFLSVFVTKRRGRPPYRPVRLAAMDFSMVCRPGYSVSIISGVMFSSSAMTISTDFSKSK